MRRTLALLAVLLVTGCMSDGSPGIREGDLEKLVLQPSDLPAAFQRFDEGHQVQADFPAGTRADPARFGRVEGWKARYRRPGTSATRGPLVVESRVDLFESDDGAGEELDAHRAEQGASGMRRLPEPDLGEEAFAGTLVQGGAATGVRFYLVAWRDRDVTASVFVNGFDGKLTLDEALELARRQQRRIEAA